MYMFLCFVFLCAVKAKTLFALFTLLNEFGIMCLAAWYGFACSWGEKLTS
jgi:hypothetical protein